MILISHRGNLTGRKPDRENTMEYITEALDAGFHVEVDVWQIGWFLYLGHDKPNEKVSLAFLVQDGIIVHCKNEKALKTCLKANIHCFFHDKDACTLTSKGYIWTYPGSYITEKSIALFPELYNYNYNKCAGICSDRIKMFSYEEI